MPRAIGGLLRYFHQEAARSHAQGSIAGTCDSARWDWEIEEVMKAALLPVVPTLALRQDRSPCEVQALAPFEYFGRTG